MESSHTHSSWILRLRYFHMGLERSPNVLDSYCYRAGDRYVPFYFTGDPWSNAASITRHTCLEVRPSVHNENPFLRIDHVTSCTFCSLKLREKWRVESFYEKGVFDLYTRCDFLLKLERHNFWRSFISGSSPASV